MRLDGLQNLFADGGMDPLRMVMSLFLMTLIAAGVINLLLAITSLVVRRPFANRLSNGRTAASHRLPPDRPRFISVHVAVYDEPAAMVIASLDSLARSDHPDFEVLVIDNNTPDAATWMPVRRHVETLGPRFRFFHFDGVAGAKAGALNLALGLTDERAAYVAIVDADYQVSPDFLSTAVAACGSAVQFVQFPQAYRCSAGAGAVVAELADYFETFPRAANRAQAALLTGTLSLISIDALRSVGGWPTHSITEDAQLGLALWSAGARGLYVDREAGLGLLPMDLSGLRVQRRRWVTGNVQTLLTGFAALTRARPGSIAVIAQLTAWLGLLALPLSTLVLVAVARAWPTLLSAAPESEWRLVEVTAVATFFCVLAGHAIPAIVRRRVATLGVTLAMLWSSSFGWLPALRLRPLSFRRTPKSGSARRRGLSLDSAVSVIALLTAAVSVLEGSVVTACVLAISACGLVTAPFVDRSLRHAGSRAGAPCAA